MTASLRIEVDGEIRSLLAAPDGSVAELAAALGYDPARPLWIDGRRSAPVEALSATGLVHGSVVSSMMRPPKRLEAPALSCLRRTGSSPQNDATRGQAPDGAVATSMIQCVGGPDAGCSLALTAGRHVIGRAGDASLRVDDPLLEPYAALVDVGGAGQVTFTQLAGRTPAAVDGLHISGPITFDVGQTIELGSSRLVHEAPGADSELPAQSSVASVSMSPSDANPWYRVVHRRVRTVQTWSPAPISPPPEPTPRPAGGEAHLGWIATLFALAGGVVIAFAMGSMLFLLFGAFAAAGAVAVSIGRWVSRRRRARRDAVRQAEAMATFDAAVDAQAQAFVDHHRATVPTVPEIVRTALHHGAALWERRCAHTDALTVALGWGVMEWSPVLAPAVETSQDPGSPYERRSVIDDLLIRLPLHDGATVAIVGDGAAVVRSLLVQLATSTGPADWEPLVIVDRPGDWSWCDWLPHAGGDSERRCLAADDDDAVVAALDMLDADDERTVVIVTDRPELLVARTGPVRRFLSRPRPCALVVLVPPDGAAVPAVCKTVVDIGSRGRARWTPDATVAPPHRVVHLIGVTVETAALVARRLAGLVDPESPECARDAVPRQVALGDVLETGVVKITPDAVARWWADNDTAQRLTVPLGLGDGVVGIDLVADGPHALIAGTTGSGKSELLRVLVSGLAARHAPSRLNVVMVDYKGGATFDVCALLPHTVGLVTDLDDQLAERALISLRAEIRWREYQLRQVGATDLVEYDERRRQPGIVSTVPPTIPRLVVVIDEFAALAAELPDFLHSLVGIAQRGRSLGVHLILATQRPSGVVSDDIRANTNLRIALRLHDVADARDVVDDDTPARFPRGVPGRAMLRLGARERIVFQTATSAWPERQTPDGRVLTVEPEPGAGAPTNGTTALDALVRSVCEVADGRHAVARHRPWLEPLPEMLPADGFDGSGIESGAVGLLDVPDEQRRHPLRWDPRSGNLALYGSRGSGTTSTLITLVDVLARHAAVPRLHVYVIDTVGETRLDELRRLPHCGDVVRIGDRERVGRLVTYLWHALESRRAGTGGGDEPDIVWCVDGFGTLCTDEARSFGADGLGERLAALLADGPSVGIVGVITVAPGRGAATALGACANRWVFHLDDTGEGAVAGVRSSQVPPSVPGRMLDTGSQRFGQVVAPRAVERRAAASHRRSSPVSFGRLASSIGTDELPAPSRYDSAIGESQLVVGIGFDDLEPVALPVPDGEHVIVAGRARSGRSAVLRRLIDAWRQCHPAAPVAVLAPDPRSPLATPSGAAGDVLAFDELRDGLSGERALLVVDDAERYDDAGGELSALVELRRSGLCVVAAIRPEALRGEYSHWTRLVRRSRIGVVLTAGGEPDGEVIGEQLPRRLPIAARAGLAYAVSGGTAKLVQVARRDM